MMAVGAAQHASTAGIMSTHIGNDGGAGISILDADPTWHGWKTVRLSRQRVSRTCTRRADSTGRQAGHEQRRESSGRSAHAEVPVLLSCTLCTSGIGLRRFELLCVRLCACMLMSAVGRHSGRAHASLALTILIVRRGRGMLTGRHIGVAASLLGARSRLIAVLGLRRSRRAAESFIGNEPAEADFELGTAHVERLALVLVGLTRGVAEVGLASRPSVEAICWSTMSMARSSICCCDSLSLDCGTVGTGSSGCGTASASATYAPAARAPRRGHGMGCVT